MKTIISTGNSKDGPKKVGKASQAIKLPRANPFGWKDNDSRFDFNDSEEFKVDDFV